MNAFPKINLKYLFTGILSALMLLTLTNKNVAANISHQEFRSVLTSLQDTITPNLKKADSLKKISSVKDTIPLGSDSLRQKIDTFSIKMSNDSLEGPVNYEAEDSAVVLIQNKKILLYGKTKTDYQDITLTSPFVELDQPTNILTAVNRKDSTGAVIEGARFKQGETDFTSDTIRFNFKTQKGLTKHTITQSGEMYVHGATIKKVSATTFFVSQGLFTTCNLDEPHFAFRSNKLKVINNKLAVSGPTHPEFEGVPVPIYLPFGFYPMSRGRHSGILAPQFTTNDQFGLGLENGGYYKVLSEYFDVTLRGNIYSYGGWTASISPTYRKRYRYNGALSFSLQHTNINFKGDPDFVKNRSFQINWSHSVDSRARPGTMFSANVSAGSTQYNRFVPNDPNRNFNNNLTSSIQYSKSWIGKPYNLTLSANHSQNSLTRLIQVSLPDAGFTVNTLYPFQSKAMTGTPKWYEKLGIAYNGSFRNQFSFYDSAFRFRQLIDTLQWGAQHSIPITLSLPPILGGAILVSPSISYSELWIAQKFHRTWNGKKVDTVVTKGIYTDRTMSAGLSFNTALFGTYHFKNSRIMAIRHVVRPTVSINYKPDLSKRHFYDVVIDSTGYKRRFSEFDGSLFGYYSEGEYGGLNFQIDNNLEMKVRSKKDTGDAAIKKIRLIDGFGVSSAYNFFADSLKLAPFQFYLRSTLFEKINITGSATLDPYKTDSMGSPINRYAWQDGKFSLGRISSGSIAISTDFRSKPKDAQKEEERKKRVNQQLTDPTLKDDQNRLMDYMRQNPAEFVDFNIPWTLGLSFSLNFYEQLRSDLKGFDTKFTSNLSFNGTFSLSPKWQFGMNGYYNLNTTELQTFQLSISRDMHCWQMAISVAPVGLYRFFSLNISPKSSLLQDLRVNRTRSFYTY